MHRLVGGRRRNARRSRLRFGVSNGRATAASVSCEAVRSSAQRAGERRLGSDDVRFHREGGTYGTHVSRVGHCIPPPGQARRVAQQRARPDPAVTGQCLLVIADDPRIRALRPGPVPARPGDAGGRRRHVIADPCCGAAPGNGGTRRVHHAITLARPMHRRTGPLVPGQRVTQPSHFCTARATHSPDRRATPLLDQRERRTHA